MVTITAISRFLPVLEDLTLGYTHEGDVAVLEALTPLLAKASQLKGLRVESQNETKNTTDVSHIQWTLPHVEDLEITHLPVLLAPKLEHLKCDWCTPLSFYHLLVNAPHLRKISIIKCSNDNAMLVPLAFPRDREMKLTHLEFSYWIPPCLIPLVSSLHLLTSLQILVSLPSWYDTTHATYPALHFFT
jgi:hypothetical protein